MSGTMRIRFEPDMPLASVEVLTPDLEPVERVAIRPGEQLSVDVPSERSFVRVHLPSGRIVTIPYRSDLSYVIGRAAVEGGESRARRLSKTRGGKLRSLRAVRRYHGARAAASYDTRSTDDDSTRPVELYGPVRSGGVASVDRDEPELADGTHAVWEPAVPGELSLDDAELAFAPAGQARPYTVRVVAGAVGMTVLLPGRTRSAYLRSDAIADDRRLIGLRVATTSEVADTVGAYLARGDYYSAETLSSWAEQAEDMFLHKFKDPYAAAMGAYLLLRLERYDLMRNWARNLADSFDYLPDGCVIWAWQILRQGGDEQEARSYLEKARSRGLPVYSEGLRLLGQALPLMGDEGRKALQELGKMTGRVLWSSPFTTLLSGTPAAGEPATTFDVAYAPMA